MQRTILLALQGEDDMLYAGLFSLKKCMTECMAERPTWRVPAMKVRKELYKYVNHIKSKRQAQNTTKV